MLRAISSTTNEVSTIRRRSPSGSTVPTRNEVRIGMLRLKIATTRALKSTASNGMMLLVRANASNRLIELSGTGNEA